MESKQTERPADRADMASITPEIRIGAADPSMRQAFDGPSPRRRRRLPRATTTLSVVAALVGVTSLAASAWIYSETRRETLRLATDLAQVRLSLDLYARSIGTATPATPAVTSPNAELSDLYNRLAILEQNWRSGATALPAIAPSTATPAPTSAGAGDDCLPSGMRILVAAGDSYPICGQNTAITVANVDNGFMSLSDGTMVVSGGTMPLPGTSCMIGVTSGGDEGVTGYAEIRVTC